MLTTPSIKSGKVARVVLLFGHLRLLRRPTKAAELMLDSPNFFLSNVSSLHIGCRLSPIPTDANLLVGNLYAMFPIKRLSSLVSPADMAFLFMASNRVASPPLALRYSQSQNRDGNGQPELMVPDGGFSKGFLVTPELIKYRLSTYRSRKPLLETINEESVCSKWTIIPYRS